MPVTVRKATPGDRPAVPAGPRPKRTPRRTPSDMKPGHAEVLTVLAPRYDGQHEIDWPTLSRRIIAERSGYAACTRIFNGIKEGSKTDRAHPGLIALGFIEELTFDFDGVKELAYKITPRGVAALRDHITKHGPVQKNLEKSEKRG